MSNANSGGANPHGIFLPCNGPNCQSCPNFNTAKNNFKSSITNKQYNVINNKRLKKITCKIQNIIYLMTCKKCGVQYVGETGDFYHKRMNKHRSNMNCNKYKSLIYNHSHYLGYENHSLSHNILDDFSIQPIEILKNNTSTSKRQQREEYWMKELKTLYPYGLNDKCGNSYYSDYQKDRLVYSVFNKQIIERKSRGTGKNRGIVQHSDSIKRFVTEMNRLVTKDGNWRSFCFSFLTSMPLKIINSLKSEIHILQNVIKGNKNVSDFISDIINFRMKKKKQRPDNFMRIVFDNPGVELINIASLLHKVHDAIPSSFSRQTTPTVLFLRTPSIGSKIFNYKDVIENIETKKWLSEDHPCNCSDSSFCDPHHGHIMTGDLNFITNLQLRTLLSKGPSYRERNKLDWRKVYHVIKNGVKQCQKDWCSKETVDDVVLSEWKNRLLYEVRVKIESLKKMSHGSKSRKVLNDKKVKTFLNKLHDKYVIVPTDKAGNNFSIVCKTFYINCLLKELNVSMDDNTDESASSTYKRETKTVKNIVDKHISYMKKHNIPLTESQHFLPLLYWIPKMHKNPSKQRYIAASHCCTTKPLSKKITYCLKLIQQTHTNYCNVISKRRGFNQMWITKNSSEVLENIAICNKGKVRNVRTYDFSTLYTSIPHKILKKQIAIVINQVFDKTNRQYICTDKFSASWSRSEKGHGWNAKQLIKHINYLIDNIYVVCGDKLFRQEIGIPMGTDCAPFLANLFLYSYEAKWLDDKLKAKDYDTLNKFKYCFRYIDDLLCINNDQLMDDVMKEIYPSELNLTSDNSISKSNYLDLCLEVSNHKLKYKLYDKRDDFGFTVVNFPDLSGNVPKKHSYGVFMSQLIRIAKCCEEKIDFVERTSILTKRLVKQHFSPHLLKRTFDKFAASYYELTFKYGVSSKKLCPSC